MPKQCAACGKPERYKKQPYCFTCCYEKSKRWAIENKQRKADINRRWRRRNADRRRIMNACTNAMWAAIRNGRMKRGDVCTFCQSTEAIEAAHTDYSKPFQVIWLCRKCHRQWDAIRPKTRQPAKKPSL